MLHDVEEELQLLLLLLAKQRLRLAAHAKHISQVILQTHVHAANITLQQLHGVRRLTEVSTTYTTLTCKEPAALSQSASYARIVYIRV